MSSIKNQQGAHGIGQIEEQLNDQMEAAEELQGLAEADRHIKQNAKRSYKDLKQKNKS